MGCCNNVNRSRNTRSVVIRNIQNEIRDYGYYINTETGQINVNSNIPITESLILGDSIVTKNGSSVNLKSGIYKVYFSSTAIPAASGTSGITLSLNDIPTNISSNSTSVINNIFPLSASGLIVARTDNTVLTLINDSSATQNYKKLNLIIEKIA